MRRWVAMLFLLLIAFYIGAAQIDRCDESPKDCGQVCHLLCSDGCAEAPIPVPPVAPPPDALPKPVYDETAVRPVLTLELEPEKAPPRG